MALVESDAEPYLVLCNDAFRALFGLSRGKASGRPLTAAFRGAAADQLNRAVRQCLSGGEAARLRVAHVHGGDVVRLHVEVRRLQLQDATFAVICVSPHAAMSLSELGEAGVLAEIGALSRGVVYIHDVGRGLLRYSRHPLVKTLGLTGGPLDLDHIRKIVHPDDRPAWERYAAEQVKAPDDRVSKATFRVRGADGAWIWIEVRTRVFARDAAGQVLRVIGVATDVTDVHIHAAAMAEAAAALAHAELNERRRIGRELHDSTAQLLVAARLGLGALERHAALPPDALRMLEEARASIAEAQQEIRNFSYMFHPPALQDEGLEKTLRTFAMGFGHRTGIDIRVEASGAPWDDLPDVVEVSLFRVAQEALMNVYRHAKARTATLRLQRLGSRVVLEVEDDGVGVPPDADIRKLAGVGVSGMQARMTQIGGDFTLTPGAVGLKVRVSVGAALAVPA
jgi:PAS domain S-box-containing protein